MFSLLLFQKSFVVEIWKKNSLFRYKNYLVRVQILNRVFDISLALPSKYLSSYLDKVHSATSLKIDHCFFLFVLFFESFCDSDHRISVREVSSLAESRLRILAFFRCWKTFNIGDFPILYVFYSWLAYLCFIGKTKYISFISNNQNYLMLFMIQSII